MFFRFGRILCLEMVSDVFDNISFSEVVSIKERKKKKKFSGVGLREKRGRESGDGAWV